MRTIPKNHLQQNNTHLYKINLINIDFIYFSIKQLFYLLSLIIFDIFSKDNVKNILYLIKFSCSKI